MDKKKPNVNKIIHLMFNQTKDFIFFILFAVLVSGFGIVTTVVSSFFISALYSGEAINISMYVAPIVLLSIGLVASIVLMSRFRSNITASVTKELKEEAYVALLQAEMAEFDKETFEKEVGGFVGNVEKVSEEYIGKNVLSFIFVLILVVSSFVSSIFIEPLFSLIVLAIIPLYTTADKTCAHIENKSKERYQEEIEKSNEITNETIKNLKNIKLLSGHDVERDRYELLNNKLTRAAHVKNISSITSKYVLPLLFICIALAAIFGVGGLMKVNNGGYTVALSSFLAFLAFVPVIIYGVYKLFHFQIKKSCIEQEVYEIEKIIDLRSEVRSEPISSLDEIHIIKFDNVGMGEDSRVLNNASFEVRQGEKVGILSLSKDTRDAIFDLMVKITKPADGVVSFNNCELNKINARYLRTLITSIYDGNTVFNDTIMNNICYGYEFDEYKYNDALYRSGLKQLIPTLEDKDQTVLDASDRSEFAIRVIFANAFYQDKRIYLINDACSGLSADIESKLINEVFNLKNKTVILETDKAFLLSKCDKIIVIEDGKIIEVGTYKELLSNKKSSFYRLIKGPSSRKAKAS